MKFLGIFLVISLIFSCASTPTTSAPEKAREEAQKAFEREGMTQAEEAMDVYVSSSVQDEPSISFGNATASVKSDAVASTSSNEQLIPGKVATSSKQTKKGKEPVWIKKPTATLPEKKFLCAVGSGTSIEQATDSATAALARIIRQDIASSTKTTEFSQYSSTGETAYNSELQEIIETETMINSLVGITIHEFYEDKNGTIFALAALDREKASTYYQGKIHEILVQLDKVLQSTKNQEGKLDAYVSLQRSKKDAEVLANYLDILNCIDYSSYQQMNVSFASVYAIQQKATDFASSITIDILIRNDIDNRVATVLAKNLGNEGFKTRIAQEKQSNYAVDGYLSFQEIPSEKNVFVRYSLDTQLVDTLTGTVYFPYATNGREGHISFSEAQQRALRSLEKKLDKDYIEKFINLHD